MVKTGPVEEQITEFEIKLIFHEKKAFKHRNHKKIIILIK